MMLLKVIFGSKKVAVVEPNYEGQGSLSPPIVSLTK